MIGVRAWRAGLADYRPACVSMLGGVDIIPLLLIARARNGLA
jgi:hypothetical protein